MATEAEIGLKVRLDDLRKELNKIPGMTEDVMKKMSAKAEKEWTDVEKASARAASKVTRDWERTAKNQEQAFEKGAKGMKKLANGAGFGGVAGDIEDVVEGIAAMGPAAGVAAATLGSLLVLAAGATALYKIGEWAATAALNLKDMSTELAGFSRLPTFEPIPPEAIEASEDAKAALEGVSLVLKQIAMETGAAVVPVVGDVSLHLLALAVAAERANTQLLDMAGEMSKVASESPALMNALAGIADYATSGAFSGLATSIGLIGKAEAATVEEVVAAIRLKNDEAERTRKEQEAAALAAEELNRLEKDALEDIKAAQQAREKAAVANQKANTAAQSAAEATGQAVADAQDLAIAKYAESAAAAVTAAQAQLKAEEVLARWQKEAVQERFDREVASRVAAIDALAAKGQAETDAAEIMAAHWEDLEGKVGLYAAALGQVANMVDAIAERTSEAHKTKLEEIRDERKTIREAYSAMTEADQYRADARLEGIREEADAHKKAMRKAFIASQASAVALATVEGTMAVLNIMANVPAPAWPVAIPLAIAAAATQVGLVASSPPPKFHAGLDPSEFQATLARGEGVANNRAMSDPSFREQLRDANAGTGGQSGGGATVIRLNDRDLVALDRRTSRVTGRDRRQASEARLGTATHYGR